MTKNSVADYSTTAASNTDIGGVPLGEGVTLPSNVNNFERTEMAQLAAQLADMTATGQTMGGTAAALTVQVNQPWTALAGNLSFVFKNTVGANTGPVTLEAFNNVPTSLGARALRMPGDTDLVGGEMLLNGLYPVIYDPAYNSGAGAWVLLSSAGGSIIAKRVSFTTSGTYTPSAGMVYADVEGVGGGGGGGGCAAAAGSGAGTGAGGGGGGEYSRIIATSATIGGSQTVTIGAAGAGGVAGNNSGTAGGLTSVGTLLTAHGGAGGGGAPAADFGRPGLGGGIASAGTGQLRPGSTGLAGVTGNSASFNSFFGGAGGDSTWGSGAAGTTAPAAGNAGSGWGAGGGGGADFNAGGARTGGTGTAGRVIITEYCLQFGGALAFPTTGTGTFVLANDPEFTDSATFDGLSTSSVVLTDSSKKLATATLLPTANAGAPTVTSKTAMLALDTTKITRAFLSATTQDGEYRWNSASLSATLLGSNIASSAVSGNTITSNGYGLPVGTAVMAASAVNGLALNTLYWIIPVDANNFKLASTQALAVAGTAVTLTGTTATTVNQHFDPNQYIYVTPAATLNGSGGAWVASAGGWTQHGYVTETPPPNVTRINDRLLVGTGATGQDGVAGSWLFGQGAGTPMSYLLTNAKMAVVTGNGIGANIDSQYGLLGAARSVPGQGGGAIGVSGLGVNSDTSGVGTEVWGAYFESVRNSGAIKGNISVEIEVTNLNSTAVSVDPFNGPNTGSYGLEIGSGGGVATNPTSYDASCFIVCVDNGAKAKAGLVFNHLALTPDSGVFHAIEMEKASQIEWYYATTAIGTYIRSDIDTAADAVGLVFSDTSVSLLDETGASIFTVLQPVTGTVAASLTTQAGTTATNTVKVSVDGSAAAASLQISPKGAAGQIVFTGGTAGIRLAINDTGIGFFGGSEAAKQAITGALSSVTDANAKAVLTSIKNLLVAYGLATDSTT